MTTANLSDRQRMVLLSHMQQALFNPEIAANLFVNPRPMFLDTGLSEGDVQNIATFLGTVKGMQPGSLNIDPQTINIDRDTTKANLTDKQVSIIYCLIEQSLGSIDTLQHNFTNLSDVMSEAGLDDNDLRDIVIYIQTIKNIIELDRSADWL